MWQPKVPDVSPGMPAGCLQGVASQTAHLLRKGRGKPAQPDGLCALPTRLWADGNCSDPPDPPSAMEGLALAWWVQPPLPFPLISLAAELHVLGLFKGCQAPQALLFLQEVSPTAASGTSTRRTSLYSAGELRGQQCMCPHATSEGLGCSGPPAVQGPLPRELLRRCQEAKPVGGRLPSPLPSWEMDAKPGPSPCCAPLAVWGGQSLFPVTFNLCMIFKHQNTPALISLLLLSLCDVPTWTGCSRPA